MYKYLDKTCYQNMFKSNQMVKFLDCKINNQSNMAMDQC